jgi:hypothetical protein
MKVVHYGSAHIRHECDDYTEELSKHINSKYIKEIINGVEMHGYSSPPPLKRTDIEKVNCKKCLLWICDTSLEKLGFSEGGK